jgi:Family of unknown function (DUF6069)
MKSRPWLRSVTPIAPPKAQNPKVRFLLYAGLVTGIWSGLLCLIVFGIAVLCGVPFEVRSGANADATSLSWFLVLIVPLGAALVGALFSGLTLGRRFAKRLVFWTGTLIALASLSGPMSQPDSVLWSTRVLLIVMHVITWTLVVPQLARIVGDSEPRNSEIRTFEFGVNA